MTKTVKYFLHVSRYTTTLVDSYILAKYTSSFFPKLSDAFVAQCLATILLTKTGTLKITSPLFDQAIVQSDKSIKDENLIALLATPLKPNTKKKNKKKATEGEEEKKEDEKEDKKEEAK